VKFVANLKNIMPESLKQKTSRARKILDTLEAEYPGAKCHLNYKNPFQLLISTILAAQTTDVGVNLIMDELYKKYKSPADFSNADPAVLEKELSRLNFYRNKTKSVINCCRALIEKHGGEVPKTMEELVELAGVGRKTANVVLGNCFGTPAIMTDTHLIRVSNRLGLVNTDVPEKIEMELKKIIPDERQVKYSHVIGEHGRVVCKAKKPMCGECVVGKLCPSKGKV
jgi:endonuclease III